MILSILFWLVLIGVSAIVYWKFPFKAEKLEAKKYDSYGLITILISGICFFSLRPSHRVAALVRQMIYIKCKLFNLLCLSIYRERFY
jgi:hypothetical protein